MHEIQKWDISSFCTRVFFAWKLNQIFKYIFFKQRFIKLLNEPFR